MLANKLIEKIRDCGNAKEHYQSFIRKKNTQSVKQSEIITCPPKTFENSNIVGIKSIIPEHPKIAPKLSKPLRQAERVDSISSLYSDTKKSKKFLNEKKVKITKRAYAFKGYENT